jgi:hypothetical protein
MANIRNYYCINQLGQYTDQVVGIQGSLDILTDEVVVSGVGKISSTTLGNMKQQVRV